MKSPIENREMGARLSTHPEKKNNFYDKSLTREEKNWTKVKQKKKKKLCRIKQNMLMLKGIR